MRKILAEYFQSLVSCFERKFRNPKTKIQNPINNFKFKIENSKHTIQNTKYEICMNVGMH